MSKRKRQVRQAVIEISDSESGDNEQQAKCFSVESDDDDDSKIVILSDTSDGLTSKAEQEDGKNGGIAVKRVKNVASTGNKKRKFDDKATEVAAAAGPAKKVSKLKEGKFNDVACVEWTEVEYIGERHGINKFVAENIVKLFQDDNTVPFIARYRKNMTNGMDAEELRSVKNSWEKAKLMKQKAHALIKEVDKQGKWTPELHAFVHGTKSLEDLEHLRSLFKTVKSTLAERARDLGLGAPAEAIMRGEMIESLERFVQPEKEGLRTEEKVKEGIMCILADTINKAEATLMTIKDLRQRHGVFVKTVGKTIGKSARKEADRSSSKRKEDDEKKFDIYNNFSCRENNLKPHQILAINRGEAKKLLSVRVEVAGQFEADFMRYCERRYEYACRVSALHRSLLTAAFDYAWNKWIKPWIGRRTRHELNERAETASMDVFAENVKQLLLTPPVRGRVVAGLDPGFRHGCKLAVVSERGELLETATIYPHADTTRTRTSGNEDAKKQQRSRAAEAEALLSRILREHKCTIVALGNGTACRETEVFIVDLIKRGAFDPLKVTYTIVDETGASIYSCSKEARTEFPNLDANVVSAVSIARRLQDPMAELVKIEPKHLGVGMYQHDLPEKQLAAKLNEVIMEAVSFVGVDVNTASVSLLKRVAGLGDSRAKHIIEWRKSSGPFASRSDLMKVPRIGNKTFEQCAGFIRIMRETSSVGSAARGAGRNKLNDRSFNYLDQTWIHPESYDLAEAFIKAAKLDAADIGTKTFIDGVSRFAKRGCDALAQKFKTTVETMKIIIEGLSMETGQDIRSKADQSMFRQSLTSFNDLKVGTILTGVVRNNTHFGAFVDVGVEKSGLIHVSQMGGMTLSVGQRVETKVFNVEKQRGRLALTLVKCF